MVFAFAAVDSIAAAVAALIVAKIFFVILIIAVVFDRNVVVVAVQQFPKLCCQATKSFLWPVSSIGLGFLNPKSQLRQANLIAFCMQLGNSEER